MERITGTPIKAFLLGLTVTAVVQSSTATIVLTSGLVGAGIISLGQSLGIIIGATVGTLVAQAIVNHFVFSQTTPEAQHEGWTTSWFIFAAYSLVVAVLFIFIFKNTPTPTNDEERRLIKETDPAPADGMVD